MIAIKIQRRASLRWLALFLLILSNFEVKAQDPARWKDEIQRFATADAALPPPPENAIVFTGSSSIAFWNTMQEDFAPLAVINRGFGGSTIQDAIYWADALVFRYRPRAVVLYAGDNDIGLYGRDPESVLNGFIEFVSRVHMNLPGTRIYFLAIKPSTLRFSMWPGMRRANDLIRVYCEGHPGTYFVDVASPMLDESGRPRADMFGPDSLHINSKGYALWLSIIKPLLLKHEGSAEFCDIPHSQRDVR